VTLTPPLPPRRLCSCINSFIPKELRPKVTIGFCSLLQDTAAALAHRDPLGLQQLFCSVVRATLSACEGYECQEKGGIFMLAFHDMRKGVEWALTLQLALMQVRAQSGCRQMLPPCCAYQLQLALMQVLARNGCREMVPPCCACRLQLGWCFSHFA
jgi:hypothetical protein